MLSCDGLLVIMVQPAWLQESQPTSKLLCLLLPLFNRYHLPLAELGGDFYDELKSISSGYASFDYEEAEYRCGQPIVLGICWALCNVSLCTLS